MGAVPGWKCELCDTVAAARSEGWLHIPVQPLMAPPSASVCPACLGKTIAELRRALIAKAPS